MKILLVNPGSNFLINEKTFPSLGLLYLSAYLKKHGYNDISLMDMNDKRPMPESIDADIVGFYSNTPQLPGVAKLVKSVKELNRAKEPLYILGGPHISGKPDDLPEDFDIAVVGEGEKALLDIVRAKEGSAAQERIVRRGYIDDIDSLPLPDRDIIDVKSYKYFLDGELTTTMITSRGCPFGCNFCANNAWGKTLRMRSAEKIFEEASILKYKYGYRSLMFFDDTMTVNKKRMEEITRLIGALDMIYRCFIRSDTVDRGILKLMRRSGCVEVGMGIESGSQRILDIIKKGETVKKNMQAIKLCHELGIRVKGFFIVGLPGEDKRSIMETMAFLEEACLDDLDATLYVPYPGSYVHKNKDEFDISFKDDYDHAWFKGRPDGYTTTVSTSALTSGQILKYRDDIEKRFKKGSN